MRLAVLGLVVVAGSAWAQPQTPLAGPPTPLATPAPPSLIREGVTEHLTPHVWAIPDGQAGLVPNVGIIAGSKGVLVIDPGLGKRNGETVLREVNKIAAGKEIFIVATHAHPEHELGAVAFPASSKMIRSNAQQADADTSGTGLADRFAAMSPLNAELLKGAQKRPADIRFEESYELDLGGVKARVIAMGPNHTPGDTAVIAEGVLFSGDVAMRGQPSFASPKSNVQHWLKSLDKLDALKPTIIVPAHGLRGDASIIAGYRTYLSRIADRAGALKKGGKSVDEAVATITAEMSQYPDKGRLGGAIRAAYAEAG